LQKSKIQTGGKSMGKNLIVALVLSAFAATAMAAETSSSIQISRDANYIYVKQPWRVTMDPEQQATLKEGAAFLAGQIRQINLSRGISDPNGDLKGLSESLKVFSAKLDQLVDYSAQVYGEVAPVGFNKFQVYPSAVVVFAGVNADKNIFRFAQFGGSGTLAAVLVPVKVRRISIKDPQDVIEYTDWQENSGLVAMALALGGAQVSPTSVVGDAPQQADKTGRAGIGFVWGQLNKASDLVGFTGGGTATVNALVAGLNVKFLGVKNWNKPGAVNNYILLLGLQRQSKLNSKIPLTNIDAEFGANIGAIVDAGGLFSSGSKFLSDVGAVITGKNKDANR
jgi:hypothetical protein